MNINIQRNRICMVLFSCALVCCMLCSMLVVPVLAAENESQSFRKYEVNQISLCAAVFDASNAEELLPYPQMAQACRPDSSLCYVWANQDLTICVVSESIWNAFQELYDTNFDTPISGVVPDNYYSDGTEKYYQVQTIFLNLTGAETPLASAQFTYYSGENDSGSTDVSSQLSEIVTTDMISTVLDEIMDLLPVVCVVIVGFIGLRKGISFLEGVLHSA